MGPLLVSPTNGRDDRLGPPARDMPPSPRQNYLYLSADWSRLCRIGVNPQISIPWLSSIEGCILALLRIVARRADIDRIQSASFRTSVKEIVTRFVRSTPT